MFKFGFSEEELMLRDMVNDFAINELKPKILANAIKSSVRLRINTEKIKKDWNWHNEEEKLLNVYRRLK